MWDNDAPPDAPLTRAAPAPDHQPETCATCERPAPPGKLRCDLCVSSEWDKLKLIVRANWKSVRERRDHYM